MTNAQQYLDEIAWLIADRDKYRNALLHGIANLDNRCNGCKTCEYIKSLHEAMPYYVVPEGTDDN